MALDEPQEKDFTVMDQGVTFAVEKDLFEKAKPIRHRFHGICRRIGLQDYLDAWQQAEAAETRVAVELCKVHKTLLLLKGIGWRGLHF